MNRQTPIFLAILLATGLPASAASFALTIYDGADFTGNVVGQATLSTTTGYPQLDTPGTPAVVPRLDQYDFTLTIDSLDPGYSGVDGLSVFFLSTGTIEFLYPDDGQPHFHLVDPAFTVDCAADPIGNPCTERPLMLESPSGWTGNIGFDSHIGSDSAAGGFKIARSSFVLLELLFTVDDPANALLAGDSLAGFRWKSWADYWDFSNDASADLYTAARGLEAPGKEPAPIPEPGAFSLVALGLAALVAVRRRHRREPCRELNPD